MERLIYHNVVTVLNIQPNNQPIDQYYHKWDAKFRLNANKITIKREK